MYDADDLESLESSEEEMSSSDEELNDRVDGDLLDEMREANANDEMEPDENDGKSP